MITTITSIRDVKFPSFGTKDSIGIDFYIPKYSKEYENAIFHLNLHNNNLLLVDNKIVIRPHGNVLIPSGIKTILPKDTALIFHNKSGIASKTGLILGACVIDADYRGEIIYNLINTSNSTIKLDYDIKIVQGIITPHLKTNIAVIENEEYDNYVQEEKNNQRKEGGFGSTGI